MLPCNKIVKSQIENQLSQNQKYKFYILPSNLSLSSVNKANKFFKFINVTNHQRINTNSISGDDFLLNLTYLLDKQTHQTFLSINLTCDNIFKLIELPQFKEINFNQIKFLDFLVLQTNPRGIKQPELENILDFFNKAQQSATLTDIGFTLTVNSITNNCSKYFSQICRKLNGKQHISISISILETFNKIDDSGIQVAHGLQQLNADSLQQIELYLKAEKRKSLTILEIVKPLQRITNIWRISLWIKGYHIKLKEAEALGNCLSGFPHLLSLNLNCSKCKIKTPQLKFISQSLLNLQSLQSLSLYLAENNLNKSDVVNTMKIIGTLQTLKEFQLSLSNNGILSSWLKGTLLHLKNLSNLQYLDLYLSANLLEEKGKQEELKYLSQSLTNLSQLISFRLEMANCETKDKICAYLASAFKLMGQLKELNLNLAKNEIDEKGIEQLCEGLNCLQNLEKLQMNLQLNQIKSAGSKLLFKSIATLKNVWSIHLDLRYCNILEEGMAKSLSELANVKQRFQKIKLYLQGNTCYSITQSGIISIVINKLQTIKDCTIILEDDG